MVYLPDAANWYAVAVNVTSIVPPATTGYLPWGLSNIVSVGPTGTV